MNIGLELRRQVVNMRTLVYVEGNNKMYLSGTFDDFLGD